MRYRKLSSTGDYSFGQGLANFWVDSANGVAQSVQTRLGLWTGQWFLDLTVGTPYSTEVLGYNTQALYDMAIKSRVLTTLNVTGLLEYSSSFDAETRELQVDMTIDTIYGPATLSLSGAISPSAFNPIAWVPVLMSGF